MMVRVARMGVREIRLTGARIGTLSLNAALLFLDPAVVRYLLIHELCHLISLNHSRRFWAAVQRYEPDYEALDRRLTEAWVDIPFWAHPDARRR